MSEETTQVEEKKDTTADLSKESKNNRAGRKYDSSRIVKISYCFRR